MGQRVPIRQRFLEVETRVRQDRPADLVVLALVTDAALAEISASRSAPRGRHPRQIDTMRTAVRTSSPFGDTVEVEENSSRPSRPACALRRTGKPPASVAAI